MKTNSRRNKLYNLIGALALLRWLKVKEIIEIT